MSLKMQAVQIFAIFTTLGVATGLASDKYDVKDDANPSTGISVDATEMPQGTSDSLGNEMPKERPQPKGHEFQANHVAAFGGVAIAKHEARPAAAIEYEYRFEPAKALLGVATTIEAAFATHVALIGAVGPVLHPLAGAKAFVLPGFEMESGQYEFLVRVGIGYDFHFGVFTLTPAANLDLVQGHVNQVYGLAMGIGF